MAFWVVGCLLSVGTMRAVLLIVVRANSCSLDTKGAKVNARNTSNETTLTTVSYLGHAREVDSLLKAGDENKNEIYS